MVVQLKDVLRPTKKELGYEQKQTLKQNSQAKHAARKDVEQTREDALKAAAETDWTRRSSASTADAAA